MNLVNVAPLIPEAIFELRYTTSDNVLSRPLHNDTRPMLDERAVIQLVYATKLFTSSNVIPKLWDLYRTAEVQQQLLAFNNDPRYVLPADKSKHVQGLAIDLTLCDLGGEQLDMGTDFDDFTDKAWSDCSDITAQQRTNRLLLAKIMDKAGFVQLPTEWWHFDLKPEFIEAN
jgi:zinc D-Ala-D-Ala dipeptidase